MVYKKDFLLQSDETANIFTEITSQCFAVI